MSKVYLLDSTALVHYAGILYGCFLVERFEPSYLISGTENIFVTDEIALEQIKKMEQDGSNGIYKGYTTFIRNNFYVIPRKEAISSLRDENAIKKYRIGTIITFENEPFAGTFGSLFYMYKEKHIDPLLVTFEPEVKRVAKELGFFVYSDEKT